MRVRLAGRLTTRRSGAHNLPPTMEAEIRTTPRFAAAASRLSQLCAFTGSEEAFWNSCLTLFAEVAGAQAVILYRAEEEPLRWHARLALPAELLGTSDDPTLVLAPLIGDQKFDASGAPDPASERVPEIADRWRAAYAAGVDVRRWYAATRIG